MYKDRFIVAVCGHGKAGKDTVAKIISELMQLEYKESTSWYAGKLVFETAYMLPRDFYFSEEHFRRYHNFEMFYADRANHREAWAKFIDDLNKEDPTFLYKHCCEEQDILTGIRKVREFEACINTGLIDFSIWVENRENPVHDVTQEYGPELCDCIVWNRPSLGEFTLRRKLDRVVRVGHYVRYRAETSLCDPIERPSGETTLSEFGIQKH